MYTQKDIEEISLEEREESIHYCNLQNYIKSNNINNEEKNNIKDMGEVSDGYHTFNELYYNRAILFAFICNEHPEFAWKSKMHSDSTMYENMFIVGITSPYGEITYHYNSNLWDIFNVPIKEKAPKWDGADSFSTIERLKKWACDL